MGLRIVEELKKNKLDCSNEENYSLLHFAADKGYLTLLTELLSEETKRHWLHVTIDKI